MYENSVQVRLIYKNVDVKFLNKSLKIAKILRLRICVSV